MPQRIADGLAQTRGGGYPPGVVLQPDMQRLHDRPTSFLPDQPSIVGGMTADFGLDRVEFADAFQHLGGERRLGGGVKVVEFSSCMSPTKCQRYGRVRANPGQPLESGIAIDLKHAAERSQVRGRVRALAVLGVDVGGDRMTGAAPRPVIDRVAPQPSRLGPAAAGIEHRQRGVVGEQLGARQRGAEHQVIKRRQPPAGAPHPIA